MERKILVALICATLTIGSAACGGDGDGAQTTKDTQSSLDVAPLPDDLGSIGGTDTPNNGEDTWISPDVPESTDTGGQTDIAEPDATDTSTTTDTVSDTSAPDTTPQPDGSDEDVPTVADITSDGTEPEDVATGDAVVSPDGGTEDTSEDAGCTDDCEIISFEECDAGDEAWASMAIPFLLGRKPEGLREVQVVADLVKATDRATVARGLMNRPEFEQRWAHWLMDELRVNRIGDKKHATCYGTPKMPGDKGEIATWIRDNDPMTSQTQYSFNMSDVLYSSLRLDDLTPLYRAHLFAMMAKPITGANVAALEMDITRRQDFGEVFSAVYTHRNVVCAGCHNSEWAITDNDDPELDHHWQIPGLFEKGIYGQSTGRDEMEVYSNFRHLNVVTSGSGRNPWKMDTSCGTFVQADKIVVDPADIDAYFIYQTGKKASIWNIENSLHNGVEKLRFDGLQVDPETMEIDGEEAFAYLVSARIVNQVWQEAFGYPLTLVHYFPRNSAQRDLLMQLTNQFIADGWSLKSLLTQIATHALFAQKSPDAGCGTSHPYILPPVFNPWVTDAEFDYLYNNSVGDFIHRASARVLLRMVETSLQWPAHSQYPNSADEEFQKAVGVFVKDAEPGFLGVDFQGMLSWENRFGACKPQTKDGLDWITQLVMAAEQFADQNPTPLTLRDVIVALKDRLLTEPHVTSETEAELLAAFFEVQSIDLPLTEVPNWSSRIRNYCGLLLETPQFMLQGVPPATGEQGPALVVGSTSYQDLCQNLASTVLNPDLFVVECGGDTLTVTPVIQP